MLGLEFEMARSNFSGCLLSVLSEQELPYPPDFQLPFKRRGVKGGAYFKRQQGDPPGAAAHCYQGGVPVGT